MCKCLCPEGILCRTFRANGRYFICLHNKRFFLFFFSLSIGFACNAICWKKNELMTNKLDNSKDIFCVRFDFFFSSRKSHSAPFFPLLLQSKWDFINRYTRMVGRWSNWNSSLCVCTYFARSCFCFHTFFVVDFDPYSFPLSWAEAYPARSETLNLKKQYDPIPYLILREQEENSTVKKSQILGEETMYILWWYMLSCCEHFVVLFLFC